MSLLLLALAQAVAPAAAPPDTDVVVIGRKLAKWRGKITTNPFGTRCVSSLSTGDPEIDAIGCTAMKECWPDTMTQLKAARARSVAPADRKRMEADAAAAFSACALPKRTAMIDALAARRVAAREVRP